MPYQFTAEDRMKGARIRNQNLNPERRRELAVRAIYRRWYKTTDSDADRVDRHLKTMAKIVAISLADEDYDRAMRGISIMGPFERMKIALNSGLLNVTPAALEGQDEIEAKLQASAHRRARKLLEEQTVEVPATKPPDDSSH